MWSKDKPTTEGYYWIKLFGLLSEFAEVSYVYDNHTVLVMGFDEELATDDTMFDTTLWNGPLKPPDTNE